MFLSKITLGDTHRSGNRAGGSRWPRYGAVNSEGDWLRPGRSKVFPSHIDPVEELTRQKGKEQQGRQRKQQLERIWGGQGCLSVGKLSRTELEAQGPERAWAVLTSSREIHEGLRWGGGDLVLFTAAGEVGRKMQDGRCVLPP